MPNGATVERAVPNGFTAEPFVMLNLHSPDFTTSARLAEGINKLLGEGTAQSVDSVSVKVAAPADANQRTAYLATLEAIEIEPGDAPARVIVNSRTGTVVIGSHVRVMPAAVAHGSLSVTITERAAVSQPNEFAQRRDRRGAAERASRCSSPTARMFVFDAGVDLNDIVRAREPGGRRARRPGRDSRSPQGVRRVARRAHRHLGRAMAIRIGPQTGIDPLRGAVRPDSKVDANDFRQFAALRTMRARRRSGARCAKSRASSRASSPR